MMIIAGSGRSGTSAVAKLLHQSGISVGRDLIEPDEANADGYFEERGVVEANDLILRSAGLIEWFSVATRSQIIEAARPHRRRDARARRRGNAGMEGPALLVDARSVASAV